MDDPVICNKCSLMFTDYSSLEAHVETVHRSAEHVKLHQNQIVRAGVAVSIYRDDNILMIQRKGSHGDGSWSVPGGWMNFGETPVDAACREVYEEVGVEVGIYTFEYWTSDIFPDDGKHSLTLWFSGWIKSGEPQIMEPNKIADMRWIQRRGPLPEPLFLPLSNRLKKDPTL